MKGGMNLRNDGPIPVGLAVCRVLAGIFTNADEGGQTDEDGEAKTCPASEGERVHLLDARCANAAPGTGAILTGLLAGGRTDAAHRGGREIAEGGPLSSRSSLEDAAVGATVGIATAAVLHPNHAEALPC